jgi:hypothetical protein
VKIQFNAPPASAEVSNGIPVKYDNVKRKVPRWRWYLVLGIVLLIPLYFVYKTVSSTVLRASPGMVVIDQVVVRAPITGQVEQVAPEGRLQSRARACCVWCKAVPTPAAGTVQAADVVASSADHTYAMQRQDLQGQQKALQSSLQAMQGRMSLMQDRVRQIDELFRQGAATRQKWTRHACRCCRHRPRLAVPSAKSWLPASSRAPCICRRPRMLRPRARLSVWHRPATSRRLRI